ncbi:MAG: hypothetical protein OSA80_01305 [Porticoccaceae bacterium]|nr:hypothetical protein [Porticoccaceae bacterium]
MQSAQFKHLAAQQYLCQGGENTASIYCISSWRLRVSIASQSEQEFALNDFSPQYCLGSLQRVNKIFREWTEKGILGMQSDCYLIYDTSALQRELTVEES